MKFIGQHIYDFVARFRNDVYLEDISTGTIASGGNLGLDSNNKIVKAAEVGSSVDLTSEVTGTLPAGNGGTGVTSITALKNLLDDETWTFANNITGTLATAAQTNITSLGTLTALNVDDITLNGRSILINVDGSTFNATTTDRGATTLTTTDAVAGTDGHFEVAAGGNIILDAAGDIALECGGGDLTCDADTITFSSANADDPQFIIKNTTADNQGARLQLRKDRGAAMVDGDSIGEIDFFGEDASQNTQQYGKIMVQAAETAHGTEAGKMEFQVAEFDGSVTTGLTLEGQDQDGEIDVTIGVGAASTTTIAGNLAVTTGLRVVGGEYVTAIQASGDSFVDNDTSLMTSASIQDKIYGTTAVGTIGTGTWQGTAVASAYLDSDTAHLTTDQTFTGVKTFNEAINKKSLNFIFVSNRFVNSTANETYFSLGDSDRDQAKGGEDGIGVVAVMPCNGILRQVEMVSSSNLSGRSWTYRLYRIPSGTGYTSETLVATVAASAGGAASTNVTISLVTDPGDGTNDITYESGYNATTMFTKGDRALFSLQSNSDAAGSPKINTTFCFELDESTI